MTEVITPKKKISDALISAVREGKLHTTKKIIDKYGMSKWEDGYRLLCEAIRKGQKDVAEWLLNYGAKVYVCEGENTPLHLAAKLGFLRIATLLLKRRAPVDALNIQQRTPLHMAVLGRQLSTARLLLENRARVDAKDDKRSSPLHLACASTNKKLVELLLAFGADIEKKLFYGCGDETPLHIACRNGSKSVVQVLIHAGADINYLHDDYHPPGMSAFVRGAWRDSNRPCPSKTIEFLVQHIVKMQCANLFVCPKNIEAADYDLEDFVTRDIRQDCEEEVKKMKNCCVGETSYLDMLQASVRELCPLYVKHGKVFDPTDLLKRFPLYGNLLAGKMKTVSRKVQLEQICNRFFGSVYPSLPDLCVYEIRSYLEDADLRMLVCICDRTIL